MKWVGLLTLLGFIIAALADNFPFFIAYVGVLLLAVFLHDAVALGLGYASARLGGLALYEAKAVTFEVGIRNAGLGLGLVFAFFGGLGGMAVVAGWGSDSSVTANDAEATA